VFNAPMNQLYLSANHISPASVRDYVAALDRYGITHMIAYASSAAVLAEQALGAGHRPMSVRVVLTNAEPVHPWQREVIDRGLGARVRECYGMAEMVAVATECDVGRLHYWPEAGWLEVFDDRDDVPLASGQDVGRYICSSLLNVDMPLIRYEVGDRGTAVDWTPDCSCGKRLPRIGAIEGRTNDLLYAPDGRRVYWLNPVFYGLPVREAQVIQEAVDRLRVRFVPAAGFSSADEGVMRARLSDRMGRVDVVLEEVPRVPRTESGKFQAVVCRLPSATLSRVASPPSSLAGS
jgi:phenylacetate-CoA ligase